MHVFGRELDREPFTGCVGFSGFLAKIKVFWKYWAYNMEKKTYILPHEAFEIFEWTFLDGF